MTYSKSTRIWCNADDCLLDYRGGRTATETRRMAAKEGWTHMGTRDYCPDHGPEDDSDG